MLHIPPSTHVMFQALSCIGTGDNVKRAHMYLCLCILINHFIGRYSRLQGTDAALYLESDHESNHGIFVCTSGSNSRKLFSMRFLFAPALLFYSFFSSSHFRCLFFMICLSCLALRSRCAFHPTQRMPCAERYMYWAKYEQK